VDGDFGEGGEAVVDFDFSGFEKAVEAGFLFDHGADGEAGRKNAA